MSAVPNQEQFGRTASLLVVSQPPPRDLFSEEPSVPGEGLSLSDMHFTFRIRQGDTESPNNAWIRVYNLSETTVRRIKGEFSRVVLDAGYANNHGVIFDGTIRQFRTGRESATDTYLDIMAADGDLGYNFGFISKTWGPGSTPQMRITDAAKAMGLKVDLSRLPDLSGLAANPSLPRSRVGFGMARDLQRAQARSLGASWSIQNGYIQVLLLRGFLDSEAVVLNSMTGMIGIPEQTDLGISVRALINPKFQVGTTVRLNSRDINQLTQRGDPIANPLPFDRFTGIAYAAKIAEGSDGLYRIYVVDYTGDTRGQPWYADLICLAINQATNQTEALQ